MPPDNTPGNPAKRISDPIVPGPEQETALQLPQGAKQAGILSQPPSTANPRTPETPGPISIAPSAGTSGARVAGYRLLHLLGQGTYGQVWLAEDETSGVRVAIKFLTHHLGEQWQLLQAEVRQLALLHDDPGIVQLKDFHPEAARPYFVMAYAEGGSLATRLKQQGPLPLAEALPMFRRIVAAMAYVHAKGIFHCDLKPGNVLLDKMNRPRIADFGQAHLAHDAKPALGTFFFMAPDQADLGAQLPDPRWDVYALGALFYAMLTGSPPYEDSTLRQELAKTEQLTHRLARYREAMDHAKPLTAHRKVAGMHRDLARILERCLAKDPAERYPNAQVLQEALDGWARSQRRKIILLASVVAPLLVVLLLAVFSFSEAQDAQQKWQDSLIKQAQDGYAYSATVAATKVKGRVEYYLKKAEDIAKKPALSRLLKSADNSPERQQEMADLLEPLYEDQTINPKPINNVCLLDNKGKMICIYPSDHEVKDHNFAWRAYFNGGEGDDFGKRNKDYEPINRSVLSPPFKSHGTNKEILVGLSVPVRDDKNRVLGMILVPFNLGMLHDWLSDHFIPDGFAVIIDENSHVLLHRSKGERLPTDQSNGRQYTDCQTYTDIFSSKTKAAGSGSTRFVDPVDNISYVACYAPVEFQGRGTRIQERWGLILQVKEESVIKPAVELKTEIVAWGVKMMIVALLAIVGLWLGMLWLLQRAERWAHDRA